MCYNYYSDYKSSVEIKESLFQLEARINSYPRGEEDELEVSIYYNDSLSNKIIRNSIRVFPVIESNNIDLKFIKQYDSRFYFKFFKKWPKNINIKLVFDIDSLGSVKHNSVFFKKLVINKDCEFRLVPH